MQRLQAYKYELMPNGRQQRDMRCFSGVCRFVFNKALALQKANHEAGEKLIGYVAGIRTTLFVMSKTEINKFQQWGLCACQHKRP